MHIIQVPLHNDPSSLKGGKMRIFTQPDGNGHLGRLIQTLINGPIRGANHVEVRYGLRSTSPYSKNRTT